MDTPHTETTIKKRGAGELRAFRVGSPVLVVGRLDTIKICVGLYGYVECVWTEEESETPGGSLSVVLLSNPTLDGWDAKSDRAREARGDFKTWEAIAQTADLRPLTGAARLMRVAALRESKQEKSARKPDPKFDGFMAKMRSPAYRDREKAEAGKIAAANARIGSVFPFVGPIKRGDKSGFPAYNDAGPQAAWHEVAGYAQEPRENRTITELARWGQANRALECVSHWSPDPDVRALVRELDLDPMSDGRESALYHRDGWVFAARADLRREAFKLWNAGAQIVKIDEAEDSETGWSSYSPFKPAVVVRIFAAGAEEAIALATQQKPMLARVGGAKAFPA